MFIGALSLLALLLIFHIEKEKFVEGLYKAITLFFIAFLLRIMEIIYSYTPENVFKVLYSDSFDAIFVFLFKLLLYGCNNLAPNLQQVNGVLNSGVFVPRT